MADNVTANFIKSNYPDLVNLPTSQAMAIIQKRISASQQDLPPSVINPYDILPGDSPDLQSLKIKYGQKQVWGGSIYPPDMQRRQASIKSTPSILDAIASIFSGRASGGGGF